MINRAFALYPALFAGIAIGLLVIASLTMRRQRVVLRVPARLDSIRPVMARVSELAQRAHLSEQAIFQCRLAVDEACMNIIRHAYSEHQDGEIEIAIEVGRGRCVMSLTDFGTAYDPGAVSQPRRGVSVDEMQPGGLGLYLMHTVMDEVSYTPGPRSNRLVMVKRE